MTHCQGLTMKLAGISLQLALQISHVRILAKSVSARLRLQPHSLQPVESSCVIPTDISLVQEISQLVQPTFAHRFIAQANI